MTQEIVVENIRGIGITYEVVEDIPGPAEISVWQLELVSLVDWKVPPEMTWAEFFHKNWHPYERHCLDVRDCAKERQARYFGLRHAQCIQNAYKQGEVPKEWSKYHFIFPGTIVRKDGELLMPALFGFGYFALHFCPIFRQTWDLRRYRFLRWRR